MAAKFVRNMDIQTVGELKAAMADLPDDLPVYDSLGELLCLRIYEDDGTGEQFMEVA